MCQALGQCFPYIISFHPHSNSLRGKDQLPPFTGWAGSEQLSDLLGLKAWKIQSWDLNPGAPISQQKNLNCAWEMKGNDEVGGDRADRDGTAPGGQ